MADKPDLSTEKYEGAGATAGASVSWWAAGHIIGVPVGAVVGGILSQNERWHQTAVRMWDSMKGASGSMWERLAKHLPFQDKLATHGKTGAYIISGAAAGTVVLSIVGWILGSAVEVRNAVRGRAQFNRMQNGIRELQQENTDLKTEVAVLGEQLQAEKKKHADVSKAETPPLQVAHAMAHTKHASHVGSIAREPTGIVAAR